MKELLSVDVGNSKARFCYQENDTISSYGTINSTTKLNDNAEFILSSVLKEQTLYQRYPQLKNKKIIDLRKYFHQGQFLSMPVHYTETLGQDRLVNAYYAYQRCLDEKKEQVVIDAGSFLKIDFISKKGFMGGYIFPAPQEVLSLYAKGDRLSVYSLEKIQKVSATHPQSTEDAIIKAVSLFYQNIFEKLLNPRKQIVLTGGDADKFEEILKGFNVFSDPFHIHNAMRIIYKELQN